MRRPSLNLALVFGAFALFGWLSAEPKPAERDPEWAFRPIRKMAVPEIPAENRKWVRNPIDAFVLHKLLANGMVPSPEADRRTLVRRVSLDLTGLPPTPEELDAILNDPAANAYEKFVDGLLKSPRYGERWARHWLDVAHYADSHGQDQDRFRPNAWPYRDYLIRAFNDDKPYAKFIREQIAGDVLFPDDPHAIEATGFLAAGPWDESGLRDINENSIDREIARTLDRDDIVTTTMTTFAGLTVHCARCHDHKFDPIPQADYYALQAVFAGTDKAERSYDADPAIAAKRAAITSELASLEKKVDPVWLTPLRQAAVNEFEKDRRVSIWHTPSNQEWKSKNGAMLKSLPDNSWLSTGPAPERDIYSGAFPVGNVTGIKLEVLTDDSLPHKGPGRQENGNLHLSEIRISANGKALKIASASADFDQDGWGIARAIDGNASTAWGIYPKVSTPHSAIFTFEQPLAGDNKLTVELDQNHGAHHLIGRFRIRVTTAAKPADTEVPLPAEIAAILALSINKRTEPQKLDLAKWVAIQNLSRELGALPVQRKVYCGTNRFTPDGSFRPAATPRPIAILKRGEITRPGPLASPGSVEAVTALKGRFELKNPNDEGARRAVLANWLADDGNPLTWRVIVNRVWHYHFGKGIVDTPNDFGAMGGIPSHPELLDWLATEFRERGGSVKLLHKMIVTSATYRQSSTHNAAFAAKDADNRLLWRFNRGKLDAESIRDSMLQISGRLDETRYGPPVPLFATKPGIHVTPESDYAAVDLDAPASRRRSIYRFIFRTKDDPFLAALDCPDASQSAPVRPASLGAPQALALWNNQFQLRHAEHLANRVKVDAEPIQKLSRLIFLRVPTTAETKQWGDYSAKHGLANLARVLLNSSEFLFID